MYQTKKNLFSCLLLSLCLLGSSVCLAQEQLSFSLNDAEVNLRSGIALADYQHLDEVNLQVKRAYAEQATAFEEIRVFRVRGSRPLQEVSYRQPGKSLNIAALLQQAKKGDRLVIELNDSAAADEEIRKSQVVNLSLY